MEIVEIVDKNLKVLYKTSKEEAHVKGLLHKCVIAAVFNSKKQIMLIKPYSNRQDAGQYVSPVGGHVTAGETDDEALRRETKEEIGISDFTLKFKGKGIFDRHVIGRHENHYFLLYEVFTDEKPVLGNEAETSKWFSYSELKKEIKENPKDFGDAYYFIVRLFYPELLK